MLFEITFQKYFISFLFVWRMTMQKNSLIKDQNIIQLRECEFM